MTVPPSPDRTPLPKSDNRWRVKPRANRTNAGACRGREARRYSGAAFRRSWCGWRGIISGFHRQALAATRSARFSVPTRRLEPIAADYAKFFDETLSTGETPPVLWHAAHFRRRHAGLQAPADPRCRRDNPAGDALLWVCLTLIVVECFISAASKHADFEGSQRAAVPTMSTGL